MNKLDILNLPLTGLHLIEASAGTGKTYTIAALYVRLILSGALTFERELSPANILVVTFTDAATKELRDRIRARLSEAAQYFRVSADVVSKDEFLRDLRAKYPQEMWLGCAKRIDVAANFMDESAIYTIHGWCKKMLQQHAFDSLSPFLQDVLTNEVELLNKVATDYWRIHFYTLSKAKCQLILSKIATSPDGLLKAVKPALFQTETLKFETALPDMAAVFDEIEKWEAQRQTLEHQAKQAWLNDKVAINALLTQASAEGWLSGAKYRKATFQQKLAPINAWAEGLDGSLDQEELGKFGLKKLTEGLVTAHQAKANEFKFDAFSNIDAYTNYLVDQKSIDTEFKQSLHRHAIQWMRERYEEEKQTLVCMTFNDMINRLDYALDKGKNAQRLANVIREQYTIALIDEFQDTDPVQYRIFSKIYRYQDSTQPLAWFMIGDPKQAIYSFRGADIHTYLKAREATTGNHHTLGTNFRSTESLISAINQVFLHGDKNELGAFRFKENETNPLPFLSVDAKGRDDVWTVNEKPANSLTFWHWASDEAISSGQYQKHMAQVAASEIVAMLNSNSTGFKTENGEFRRIKPADIAILVRTGREADAMRRALRQRKIRSIYLSERDSVYQSPQARDVLIWLEAFASPRDERKVRAALSTATFGFTYEQLHAFVLDEVAWESHVERFIDYHNRWHKEGILATIHALLHYYELHNVQESTHDSERQLTNILHLAENLQQDSPKLEGQQALIRHLAELIFKAHNQGADETIVRLESDADLIKIVTIHKSKGLEYPLVFLPFACSFREEKEDESSLIQTSDEDRLREDLRLFYVAVTRAKYACWLSIAPVRKGRGEACQLELTAIGHLLSWQAGTPAGALRQHLAEMKADCENIGIVDLPLPTFDDYYDDTTSNVALASALTSTTYIPDDWWVASYSAIANSHQKSAKRLPAEIETAQDDAQKEDGDSTEPSKESTLSIHTLPKGATPGVLVHALLEQCAHQGFKQVSQQPALQQQLINQVFKTKTWTEDKKTIMQNALQAWLTMELVADQGIRLCELASAQYKSELEFLIGAESVNVEKLDALIQQHTFANRSRPALAKNQLHGLLKGFIDLVFIHNEHYFVVDYKFNCLGDSLVYYSDELLTQTMLEHRYDLQYSLYLLALHRLLKLRLGEEYAIDKHLGGAVYLFLRGNQRVFAKPSREFIEQLDYLFSNANTGKE